MAEVHTTERRLWFGIAAGASAWAADSLAVNLICSQACKAGRDGQFFTLSPVEVRWLLGAITVALLLVALAAATTAFRNWRELSGNAALHDDQAMGRADFMALIGLFASAVFIVGIVWAGVPVIFVSLCSNYH